MNRCRWTLVLLVVVNTAAGADDLLRMTFDGDGPGVAMPRAAALTPEDGRGGVLRIEVDGQTPQPHALVIPLPVDRLRSTSVFLGADVRADAVSARPNPWNGVKVMLIIKTPAGTDWPQIEIPVGSFGWTTLSRTVDIPADATSVALLLGLEKVTGRVWFDNVYVRHRKALTPAPAADPDQPIFRGHSLPRLRGAMAGGRLTEPDIEHFARQWGGNLLRWQFFESARENRPLEQYDVWLDGELAYFDQVRHWCRRHGVLVALDLHSPPGGEAFHAGYITAKGDLFRRPQAQAKFIEVWRRIAERYKGDPVIWGFDLVNEPDDSMLADGCLDWHDLAEAAGRAVREIDPQRTLIVEPNGWGGAAGFAAFQPINLPRVVYSFHVYAPGHFTHQGILGNPAGVEYPGEVHGQYWDQAALRRYLQPAIDFANRYRVHMYVGEFSAIRTAPPGSAARYLTDATDLFEQLGYDWTYHAYREWQGWSLEHEGPLNQPRLAVTPTDRLQVILRWMKQNERSLFADR